MPKTTPFARGIILALLVLIADQAHKWYMLFVLRISEIPPIEVTPFFNLVMVWNKGISFGMFQNNDYAPLIFTVIALIIIVFLILWMKKLDTRCAIAGCALIIGGALGNVIDRVRFGAVADFFDFHVTGYHWPAFNIADSAVFIGAVMLCLDSFIFCSKSKDEKNAETKN